MGIAARGRELRLCVVGVVALGVGRAGEAGVEWTDWIAATDNYPSTNAFGQFGGAFAGVSVNYVGAAFGTQTSGGADYWSPAAPYVAGPVTNPPPPIDGVVLGDFTNTHTLTFTAPVTNPVMAIAGLGHDPGSPQAPVLVTWSFSQSFTLLSGSQPGYFGAGSLVQPNATTLQGIDAHGLIQFQGTFTSLTWTNTPGEDIGVFTVGLIPSPGAAWPITVSLLGLASRRRR